MSNWRLIMNRADVAMKKMILDREKGESLFQALIDEYGVDGMIFYKRAQAYEELAIFDLALEDYRMAKSLFPMDTWISAASNGIFRMNSKIDKKPN